MTTTVQQAYSVEQGYETLHDILHSALEQAQNGKGKVRHANENELFEEQLICQIEKWDIGFNLGQAVKKIVESKRLPPEQACEELRGAIVYIAAKIYSLEQKIQKINNKCHDCSCNSTLLY